MAIEIPSTDNVEIETKQLQTITATSKEVVFTIFDFKNTVGYIALHTKDATGVVIAYTFCKVSGDDYLGLIGKPVTAGVLASIVITEIASFAGAMDMSSMGIDKLDGDNLIREITNLMYM